MSLRRLLPSSCLLISLVACSKNGDGSGGAGGSATQSSSSSSSSSASSSSVSTTGSGGAAPLEVTCKTVTAAPIGSCGKTCTVTTAVQVECTHLAASASIDVTSGKAISITSFKGPDNQVFASKLIELSETGTALTVTDEPILDAATVSYAADKTASLFATTADDPKSLQQIAATNKAIPGLKSAPFFLASTIDSKGTAWVATADATDQLVLEGPTWTPATFDGSLLDISTDVSGNPLLLTVSSLGDLELSHLDGTAAEDMSALPSSAYGKSASVAGSDTGSFAVVGDGTAGAIYRAVKVGTGDAWSDDALPIPKLVIDSGADCAGKATSCASSTCEQTGKGGVTDALAAAVKPDDGSFYVAWDEETVDVNYDRYTQGSDCFGTISSDASTSAIVLAAADSKPQGAVSTFARVNAGNQHVQAMKMRIDGTTIRVALEGTRQDAPGEFTTVFTLFLLTVPSS